MTCTCLNLNDLGPDESSIDPLCPHHGTAAREVATEGEVRALLRDLVHDIDAANGGDQLEGYFDYLAEDYNQRLTKAGLPTFGVYGERA